MAKYNQDLTLPANNDLTIRFENIINESNGLVITIGDVVGASWAMSPLGEEVTPLISKDLISGGILVPEDGVVLVQLSASDTAGLSGEFTHELRLRDASGVKSASRGKLRILYQVASNPL